MDSKKIIRLQHQLSDSIALIFASKIVLSSNHDYKPVIRHGKLASFSRFPSQSFDLEESIHEQLHAYFIGSHNNLETSLIAKLFNDGLALENSWERSQHYFWLALIYKNTTIILNKKKKGNFSHQVFFFIKMINQYKRYIQDSYRELKRK